MWAGAGAMTLAALGGATRGDTKIGEPVSRRMRARAESLSRLIDTRYQLENNLFSTDPNGTSPSFNWGAGVMLTARVAMAAMDDKHRPDLARFITACDAYWKADDGGLWGYDASANNANFDRYYDDNQWMSLALVEAFELTGERSYLERADACVTFSLSGRDDKLGDGIYWHEQNKDSKNTCSNAPAVAAMLRVAQHLPAKAESHRQAARALYDWTKQKLRDPADGLMWDNITLAGEVVEDKFSYNAALMLRSALLFAAIETDESDRNKWLDEAREFAVAAEKQWVLKTGALEGEGRFAHLLADAYLDLTRATGETKWRDIVVTAADFVWEHCRDNRGLFGRVWHEKPGRRGQREMIEQASVLRTFAGLAAENNRGQ